MLYTPLLPGAAAGTLEPRHVVVPLREQLHQAVDLRLGRITGATPERNALQVRNLEGSIEDLTYDRLIVTVGSVSRTLPVPGLAEHSHGFKSLPEAIALRNHVIRTLEHAETLEDIGARREYLTYVFVGAGLPGSRASPSCRTSSPMCSSCTRAAASRASAGSSSRPMSG